MPKRKRSESEQPPSTNGAGSANSTNERALAKQRAQLPQKIEAGKKALNRALKLARGFERQKLSRRRKTAAQGKKEKDVERIDAEVGALKKLDYHKIAEAHLYRTLLKIKTIAESLALPPWVRQPARETDPATLNVTARLYNANPTKEAMSQILGDIRGLLGLDSGDVKGPKVKKAKGESEEKGKGRKETKGVPDVDEEDEESSVVSGDEEEGEQDSEDEFAGFDDRIAGSSDEESGDEGDFDDDDGGAIIVPKGYKPTRDLSITPDATPSPSPSASASPEPPTRASAALAAKSKPATTTKSTFIPSLTMGGYMSNSDSEAEDLDEEMVAPARKNRRGQRARQQLWEKKYGTGAKHLQKSKDKKDRNTGWDARKGATDAGGAGKGRFGKGGKGAERGGRFDGAGGGGRNGAGRNAKGPTAANAAPLGERKKNQRDDQGKLHPSWEAAKKAKEKSAGAVKFEGKKVVFD